MISYSDEYIRCQGRQDDIECMTCARFDAAVSAFAKCRTSDELEKFTWLSPVPSDTPCPLREQKQS